MATKLSKNFTLEELCASPTARRNGWRNDLLTTQQVINLTALAQQILQPLRDWYGGPIIIGSGYRSEMLNNAVGGVKNSQHMQGQAADLFIDGDTVRGLTWFGYIERCLTFDKLIWEYNSKGTFWVHASFCVDGSNRGIVIRDMLKK